MVRHLLSAMKEEQDHVYMMLITYVLMDVLLDVKHVQLGKIHLQNAGNMIQPYLVQQVVTPLDGMVLLMGQCILQIHGIIRMFLLHSMLFSVQMVVYHNVDIVLLNQTLFLDVVKLVFHVQKMKWINLFWLIQMIRTVRIVRNLNVLFYVNNVHRCWTHYLNAQTVRFLVEVHRIYHIARMVQMVMISYVIVLTQKQDMK